MELLKFTIAAGETKRFEYAGRYLEVISAPYALNLELTGPNGEQADDMIGALAGFYSEGPFSGFEVTNPGATAQAVTLMVTNGRGGSRRQPGIVSVQQLVGGASQVAGAGLPTAVGFSATEIVAPAANLNGITVRQVAAGGAISAAGPGQASNVFLIAALIAPTTGAGLNRMRLIGAYNTGTVYAESMATGLNITIPPGWGIWACTDHTLVAASAAGYNLSFEVL